MKLAESQLESSTSNIAMNISQIGQDQAVLTDRINDQGNNCVCDIIYYF